MTPRISDVTIGSTLGTGEFGIVYEIVDLVSEYTSDRAADDDNFLLGENILGSSDDLENDNEYGEAEEVSIEIKKPRDSTAPRMPSSVSKSRLRSPMTRAGDPCDGNTQKLKNTEGERVLGDSGRKPPRSDSVAGDNTAVTAPNLPRNAIRMEASSPLVPPKSILIVPGPHSSVAAASHTTSDSIRPNLLQASERKHRRGDSRTSFNPSHGGDFSSGSSSRAMTAAEETGKDAIVPPPPPCSTGKNPDSVSDFDELTDEDSDDDDPKKPFNTPVRELKHRICFNLQRNGRPRYALKRLKDDLSERVRIDAAIDLACEAEFLKRISHSNIVRLRAVVGEPGTLDYALILDLLTQTLNEKLVVWRKQHKECRGKWGGIFGRDQEKLQRMLTDRLLLSFDIARAMQHIHKKNICYRDLKPENAGFNVRGDVKLFDFGLAKELKECDLREPPDGFEATGLTGSRRYMAPEVVRCDLYGFSADVYSFAILFWEIMSLKTPFPDFDTSKHFEHVVLRQKRPGRLPELPSKVHSMMEDAWSPYQMRRPKFREINQVLMAAITDRVGMSADVVSDRSTLLRDQSIRSLYGDDEAG